MKKILGMLVAASVMILAQESLAAGSNVRPPTTNIVLVPNTSIGSTSMAVSSDGNIIAIPVGNGAEAWDTRKKRKLRRFSGLDTVAQRVAISPNGRSIAAVGGKTILIWSLDTGELQITLTTSMDLVEDVSFSLDGTKLYYTGSGKKGQSFEICDIASNRASSAYRGNTIDRISISPNGDLIAGAGGWDGRIHLLDNSGREVRSFKAHSGASPNTIKVVVFSTDGAFVASAGKDNTLKIWNAQSGRLLKSLAGLGDEVTSVAWSPNNAQIAASDEHGLRIWDFATGQEVARFSDIRQAPIAFADYGEAILFSGDRIGRLDLQSKRQDTFGEILSGALLAGTDLNQSTIAVASFGNIYSIDVTSGRPVEVLHSGNANIGWRSSKDLRKFVGTDGASIFYWDETIGSVPKVIHKKTNTSYGMGVSAAGDKLATKDGNDLQIITTSTGRVSSQVQDYKYSLATFSFSPNSNILATLSPDAVQLWSGINGKHRGTIKIPHIGVVSDLVFAADGKHLLVGDTKFSEYSLNYYSVDDQGNRLVRQISIPGLSSIVSGIALGPGDRSVIVGSFDSVLRLWDLETGRLIQDYRGHHGPIFTVSFTSKGERIASGDGTELNIWNTSTGDLLASVFLTREGEWLTVTPEGFFDSSNGGAKILTAVRGRELIAIDQFYNALYRPDLVREKLAGDPNGKVKAAAAQLDLDKVMASGMAPKVTITSPASGSSSETDEVAVEATIAGQGGGIGKIEWRINGVTLGLETRGLDRIEGANDAGGAGRIQTVKRKLSLEPGDNRIEVVAYNAKGLIASEPAQITVKWDGAKTAKPPKLYVLAVGVNDYYDSRLHLAYAVPDATALADAFKKAGADLYAGVEVKTVLDNDVTLTNLDKTFAELSKKVQPRDVFVFFLAGHGKTKNGRYYFLPRDFRYEDENSIEKAGMGQDKFQAWFAEIPARKSILLYDTCESGSLTGATRGSDVDERLGALNRMARATGRTFLTATTDDAPALEGYRGHGVFTYALLDALDHGDINKNGLIEVSELADYIDQKVPDYSFEAFKLRQIPQRSIIGNNFALANKAEVLATSPDAASANSAQPIPTTPTHVVIAPVDVKDTANDTAATITHLAPGTQVRLMQTANGWTLIARDGRKLGYVANNSLLGLQ